MSVAATQELLRWMREVFPGYQQPAHLVRIFDAISPVILGERLRVVLCTPPRHGKTTAVQTLIAWMLCHTSASVAYASYGDGMAREKARDIKRLILELRDSRGQPLYPITRGDSKENEWTMATTGARFRAGGIDTGWTGRGYNLIVVDDPIKNRQEAESPVVRDSAWSGYMPDLWSRQQPEGTAIVVIQTRWQMEDVAGRLLRGDGGEPFTPVIMPAIDENGNALWPEAWPVERMAPIRDNPATKHEWWSLYQQEPRARGSEIFREPLRFDLEAFLADRTRPLHTYRWALALDPAATAKTHADHSAAALLAFDGTGEQARAWVVDLYHAQVEVPELVQAVSRLRRQWADKGAAARIGVEAVGGFKAVPQMLRRLMPAELVVDIRAASDKITRALPLAQAWNEGRVLIPENAPWADKLIDQCLRFTGQGDSHDDIVDALAHCWVLGWRARPALVRGERSIGIYEMG